MYMYMCIYIFIKPHGNQSYGLACTWTIKTNHYDTLLSFGHEKVRNNTA